MTIRLSCAALTLAILAGCQASPTRREYALKGQVLSVGERRQDGRREVSLAHEDIPGFMPAMTMAYVVRQPALLDGVAPGDLITAQLVIVQSVTGTATDAGSQSATATGTNDMYLERVVRTGHAPLPAGARPVKVMDVMAPGDEVPDDELRDQDGRPVRLSAWRGKAVAVTFVYTRCPMPDFCPLLDRQFAALQRGITADAALRGRAHLVSVSFDPSHDTVPVIAGHAKARGADASTWSYLTGPPAAIDRFTSRFGVSVIDEHDATATITHNLRTAIVDRRGRLVKIHSGSDWTVDALLADLRDAAGR